MTISNFYAGRLLAQSKYGQPIFGVTAIIDKNVNHPDIWQFPENVSNILFGRLFKSVNTWYTYIGILQCFKYPSYQVLMFFTTVYFVRYKVEELFFRFFFYTYVFILVLVCGTRDV